MRNAAAARSTEYGVIVRSTEYKRYLYSVHVQPQQRDPDRGTWALCVHTSQGAEMKSS